jgi:cholest-4-en-3-one 26-monooxygenase
VVEDPEDATHILLNTCGFIREAKEESIGAILDACSTYGKKQVLVMGCLVERYRGELEKDIPEIFERCKALIADRRENPTDDLTSVLVHAEVDGEKLEEIDIVMGFFLLMAAGNDSTKATYSSGMRALMENPEQKQMLVDDPSLVPDAVEEALRMFPAFAHFRRTATCDTELHGKKIKEGEKVVMWYVSSNRDETRYEDPDRFDVTRKPEHQAFGAGGRHFCLGTALARLELRIMIEETLRRYPQIAIDGTPVPAAAMFVNQLKKLPVCLGPLAG